MLVDTQVEEHIQLIRTIALVGFMAVILLNGVINVLNRSAKVEEARVSKTKLGFNFLITFFILLLNIVAILTYEYLDIGTIVGVVVLGAVSILYTFRLCSGYKKLRVKYENNKLVIGFWEGLEVIEVERISSINKVANYFVINYGDNTVYLNRNLKGIDTVIYSIESDTIKTNY